ncbi:MAG: hypothetical protein NC299_15330 [Lachnospiraceae bacterium]|nr:hypothetical protein [Ruminococcus sp.]MCM1276706.1 hypothetical protein [Lachnospiraceae bacterium]
MTFFENEIKKMFGKNSALTDIGYMGNTLLGRLTENAFVKISLFPSVCHGEYSALLIQVINPKNGEVDRQRLNFSDGFGEPEKSTYIREIYGDSFWQGFTPTQENYEAINRAVEQYLEMFLEPVQEMTMSM